MNWPYILYFFVSIVLLRFLFNQYRTFFPVSLSLFETLISEMSSDKRYFAFKRESFRGGEWYNPLRYRMERYNTLFQEEIIEFPKYTKEKIASISSERTLDVDYIAYCNLTNFKFRHLYKKILNSGYDLSEEVLEMYSDFNTKEDRAFSSPTAKVYAKKNIMIVVYANENNKSCIEFYPIK